MVSLLVQVRQQDAQLSLYGGLQTVVSLLVQVRQQDARLRSEILVVVNSRRVVKDVMPCYLGTTAN